MMREGTGAFRSFFCYKIQNMEKIKGRKYGGERMLEQIDLTRKLEKEEYQQKMEEMEPALARLRWGFR